MDIEKEDWKVMSSFWKDFNSENDWLFPDVAPSQLQESLGYPIVDHSERARVLNGFGGAGRNWFWE